MSTDLERLRTVGALWAAVVVLMVVSFVPALEQPGRAIRESLLIVAAPLLVAVTLVAAKARPGARFLIPVGVMAAAGLLGVLAAPSPERAAVARDLLATASPWVVAACATMYALDQRGIDTWIERGAVFSTILIGLLGLAQGWFGWEGIEQAWAPAATFVNRNVAAQALVALIPLTVAPLLARRQSNFQWVAALAAGSGLALLIATRTRGAWLGAAVGLALGAVSWLLARRDVRRDARLIPLAAVGALTLVAVFIPAKDRARQLPSVVSTVTTLAEASEGSGEIRLALGRNTLALVGEHALVGVGTGRFPVIYPLFHDAAVETPGFGTEHQAEHAHGDLLEFAAELGVPATGAMLFLLVGAIVLAFRRARDASTAVDAARNAAWVAAIGGVMAHGLVSFPLHSPAPAFLVWILVGRCWASSRVDPSVTPRRIAVAGALVLACVGLWLAARELRGQSALRDAVLAVTARDCAHAVEAARGVHEHVPWRRRDVGIAAMVTFECDKNPDSSLIALERALAIHPHQLNLLMATAARRLKTGRTADAAATYRHATEVLPQDGGAWVGLAMAQLQSGDRAGAVSSCEAAITADPAFRAARDFCVGNGLAR